MKQIFLTAALLCAAFLSQAQMKVQQDSAGNYHALSAQHTTEPPTPTGKYFYDKAGNKYPVYVTANGKLFIIRTSKKTGNTYKQYLAK